eukprot:CAMPEP_0170487900 /NCGR_PEP_ID=MMETSP0208-20121228/6603_1 /TAXON_ID=197538 /ORGANISM="Strombidium inclinatum, Strain S3" /LENGTH=130 /DNA_ID=CAMNT_0010762327 /DNA_START=991 /DNA_END=1383 /DNA_ORIENTATION=+
MATYFKSYFQFDTKEERLTTEKKGKKGAMETHAEQAEKAAAAEAKQAKEGIQEGAEVEEIEEVEEINTSNYDNADLKKRKPANKKKFAEEDEDWPQKGGNSAAERDFVNQFREYEKKKVQSSPGQGRQGH